MFYFTGNKYQKNVVIKISMTDFFFCDIGM